jgi:hypothetical protein
VFMAKLCFFGYLNLSFFFNPSPQFSSTLCHFICLSFVAYLFEPNSSVLIKSCNNLNPDHNALPYVIALSLM